MEKKDQRFDMLLTKSEKKALAALADRRGVSMADMVRQLIRQSAKRRKLL